MTACLAENNSIHKSSLVEILRIFLFIAFSALSLRVVIIYLGYAPSKILILGISASIVLTCLSLWKPVFLLYALAAAVPLISGVQIIAGEHGRFEIFKSAPILSFIFAVIYLSWFGKRLLWDKKGISPGTVAGNLIDILSGIVIISLIMSLCAYPMGTVLHMIRSIPSGGQNNVAWGIQASYIILQGLFFCRVIQLESDPDSILIWVVRVLYIQGVIIILFSIGQLVFNTPSMLLQTVGIYLPFNDIHSYGSYIVFLFGFFLILSFSKTLASLKIINIIFACLFAILIVLSYSRATWLASILIGLIFFSTILRKKSIILISCVIFAIFFANLFSDKIFRPNNTLLNRFGKLVVLEDINIDVRANLWRRAIKIMGDYPLTGSGIGTYYRISPAYSHNDTEIKKKENTHNYFLQMGSDLGVPALIIFLYFFFVIYKQAFVALKHKEASKPVLKSLLFGLSAYLITMFTGHPLILPNQQFLFWFILAVIISLSLQHKKKECCSRFISPKKFIVSLLVISVIAGHTYNLFARDIGLPGYEYGFYKYETINGKEMRWTGDETCMRIKADTNIMGITVYASPHNVGPDGLAFNILLNETILDKVHFVDQGMKPLYYYLPTVKGREIEVKTSVNKTFNPYKMGLTNDIKKNRKQGVAISPITFLKIMPKEGIGFYEWEMLDADEIPDLPGNISAKFRWTGIQATIPSNHDNYARKKEDLSDDSHMALFLRCSHPNIETDFVKVKILNDDVCTKEAIFMDHKWKRVSIEPEILKQSGALTFQVSRTWNPMLHKISEDGRDLGVAVTLVPE